MVGPPRLSWNFEANPPAKVTRLQRELVSPGQVEESGHAGIRGGNGQPGRPCLGQGRGH